MICVDSETKILTLDGTIIAKNILAGEVLMSNNFRPNKVRCVSECEYDIAREKCGVAMCTDHTLYIGSVCKNMAFDPYVLGYVMVNHLIVGTSIVIHEEHSTILNYLDEQNVIFERNGLYGVVVKEDYFGDYDYANLQSDKLRLCSNDYIRYVVGGIIDAIGSYYRGVTTINLSDDYYHIYELIHYIINRLNIKYMEVSQQIEFTTLSKSSINYYTLQLQNVTSSIPTKRFDYTYSESIAPTRTITDRHLLTLDVESPIVTESLSVLSPYTS